jgi:hypothetical protein
LMPKIIRTSTTLTISLLNPNFTPGWYFLISKSQNPQKVNSFLAAKEDGRKEMVGEYQG